MDRTDGQKRKEALRGGMFFILLALVLFFVTMIGFFTNLSPRSTLSDAMEKTEKELSKNDGVLLFIKDAFRSGEILFSGEEGEAYHTANLPEGAHLKFTKDKENLTFSSSKDQLLMTASFLEETYGASRQGAADLVSDSAFSDGGVGEEWLLLLRTYLSLTEKEGFSTEAISDSVAVIWDAASPVFTVKNAENGGKEYLYQISSEGLALELSALSEEGKNEALRGEISSLLSLAAALSEEEITPEKKKACLSFLTGEGESYDAFSKKLSAEDAKGTISFTVKSGRISTMDLRISGSDLSLHGQVTFSEKLKKDGGISVLLDYTEGEEKIFSLSFSHKITENSDSALIRHWYFQIEDGKKLFLSEKDKSSGEVTFSWGKKKGDLGLRLTLSEKEIIALRGAVGEYKSGKRLNFTVKRIEIGRRNVLSSPLEVEMTKGGNLPAFRNGEKELFCQGEERENISAKLKKSLSDIFLNKE